MEDREWNNRKERSLMLREERRESAYMSGDGVSEQLKLFGKEVRNLTFKYSQLQTD